MYSATLFAIVAEDPVRVQETLDYIGAKWNCKLVYADGVITIEFENTQMAIDWIDVMTTRFVDQGILVGSDADSLVDAFPLFRLNEHFHEIIYYIAEEKAMYVNGNWVFQKFKNELAKKQLKEWLTEYEL